MKCRESKVFSHHMAKKGKDEEELLGHKKFSFLSFSPLLSKMGKEWEKKVNLIRSLLFITTKYFV